MKKVAKLCTLVSAMLMVLNLSCFTASATGSESMEYVGESTELTFSLLSSGNNQVGVYQNGGFSGVEWEFKCDIYKSSDDSKIGELVFGYDTDAINEDYTWVRGSSSCKAGVMRESNDSDFLWSFAKNSWNWAKKEVTHNSDAVSYAIRFTDDSLDVYNGVYSGSSYKG